MDYIEGDGESGNEKNEIHDGQIRQTSSTNPEWLIRCDMKYETIIYWSDEDQAFVADVPQLPGCMAHGDTQEEALKNVNAAIQLWIDTAREFGDPVPEPIGRRLMFA